MMWREAGDFNANPTPQILAFDSIGYCVLPQNCLLNRLASLFEPSTKPE